MINLLENKILGPALLEGLEKGRKIGREEGRQEGLAEGRHEALLDTLKRLLLKRFGPLPSWALAKLEAADDQHLEAWSLDLLDASSLKDLLK